MPLFPSLPADALVKDVYPLNPDVFRPWLAVEEAIMRGPSIFTPGERELMAAFCSQLNSCAYCHSSHWEAAKLFGIDETAFDSLMKDIDTATIPEKFKPIFRFLRKLTLTPYKMVQADADTVFSAGWDERALQDVILVCCCFSFMNRLVDGHGLPSDPSQFADRGRRHFELGYLAQYAEDKS